MSLVMKWNVRSLGPKSSFSTAETETKEVKWFAPSVTAGQRGALGPDLSLRLVMLGLQPFVVAPELQSSPALVMA